jgi:hypothetical protein
MVADFSAVAGVFRGFRDIRQQRPIANSDFKEFFKKEKPHPTHADPCARVWNPPRSNDSTGHGVFAGVEGVKGQS